jgi:hypothetical protein
MIVGGKDVTLSGYEGTLIQLPAMSDGSGCETMMRVFQPWMLTSRPKIDPMKFRTTTVIEKF